MPSGTQVQPNPLPEIEKADKLNQFTRFRRSRWGRLTFTLLTIAIVCVSGYYVGTKVLVGLKQLSQTTLILKPWPIVISFIITWLCVVSGGLTWYLVLRGLGARTSLLGCTRVHLLANIASYIPGYAWKYMGMAYLASRQGVPAALASLAMLFEYIGLAVTRLAVALSFISAGFWQQITGNRVGVLLWLLRVLAWGCVLIQPFLLVVIQRRNHGRLFNTNLEVRLPVLLLAQATMCLIFIVYCLGSAVVLYALAPLSASQFSEAIFATAASYLASLLAFFVPSGIGVRESVLIFTLTGVLPEIIVVLGAVISRVVLICAELLGGLLGLGLRDHGRSANK